MITAAQEHYLSRFPELRRAIHFADDALNAGLASDRWPLVLRIARALLRGLDVLRPADGDPVATHEAYSAVRRALILTIGYAATEPDDGTAGLVVSDTALNAIVTLETTDAATIGTLDRTLAQTILDGVIWT